MTDGPQELFESSSRSNGDLAAVFQHDGEAGYFYLYAPLAPGGHKVFAALQVMSGSATFDNAAVEIRWDASERIVGLFIARRIWAAFDSCTGAGYAGDYAAGVEPEMPRRMSAALCG